MAPKAAPKGASIVPPQPGRLLVVTHGADRAREPGFLRPLLARLAELRPDLASLVDVWATGADLPDLARTGLVLFALQPAASRQTPDCWAEARRIAQRADLRWIPTLNAPSECGFTVDAPEGFDARKAHPKATLLRRLHHRKRAFVLDGEVVNGELLLSQTPSLEPADNLFARSPRLPRRLAKLTGELGRLRKEAAAADRAFFEAVPEATNTLSTAARSVGLDFASVEYALLPDGAVLVLAVEPIGELGDGTLGLLARQRGTERRVRRVLDRYAEAVAAAHAREFTAPFWGLAA